VYFEKVPIFGLVRDNTEAIESIVEFVISSSDFKDVEGKDKGAIVFSREYTNSKLSITDTVF